MTGELRRLGLDLEVVVAEAGSRCAGASVAQVEFLGAGSFLVVAIERAGGAMVMQPGPDIVIEAGDGVAIVARETHAQIMEQLFSAAKG
jgi:K+/H+ antiporter YhaU regulatory subunit KhtT